MSVYDRELNGSELLADQDWDLYWLEYLDLEKLTHPAIRCRDLCNSSCICKGLIRKAQLAF